MTIRIWHQSFTDVSLLPGYASMVKEHARRVCAADTTLDVHGVRPGTYPEGISPVEVVRFCWLDELISLQIVEAAVEAERQGYDAVAVSCFIDPGLEQARSLVDIPVVSSCETALLMSSFIGRRFALLALDEHNATLLRELVARYGADHRVLTVEALDPPVTEFELDRAFADGRDFLARFSRQAERLVERGADVIIPAEGVVNAVLARNRLREIGGTPVLDSYGTVLATAETLVRLRRATGFEVGRRGAYARPSPAMLSQVRAAAALSTVAPGP